MKDFESWIYNLTEANLNPAEPPRWFRQISFREAFNLTDLSPKTLKQFAYDLAINHEKLEQVILIIYGAFEDYKIYFKFSSLVLEIPRKRQRSFNW